MTPLPTIDCIYECEGPTTNSIDHEENVNVGWGQMAVANRNGGVGMAMNGDTGDEILHHKPSCYHVPLPQETIFKEAGYNVVWDFVLAKRGIYIDMALSVQVHQLTCMRGKS